MTKQREDSEKGTTAWSQDLWGSFDFPFVIFKTSKTTLFLGFKETLLKNPT